MGTDSEPCCALDLAMGEGRHAVLLAQAGFQTFGVDRSLNRLLTARRFGRDQQVSFVQWAADLDTYPLPAERFDLLCCTRFLLRARWDDLKRTVKPGGVVMYETFTSEQSALGRGPSSSDHLLQPGELKAAFSDWDVLFSEEVDSPAALARLVARKPQDQMALPSCNKVSRRADFSTSTRSARASSNGWCRGQCAHAPPDAAIRAADVPSSHVRRMFQEPWSFRRRFAIARRRTGYHQSGLGRLDRR